MATPVEISTLESLLEWEAEDPGDNDILERIKKLAVAHLPEGWLEWKVIPLKKEELLGPELDPQVLNKIRFAFPTVSLARAFSPDCTSLPEKVYRDMKIRMLEWPLCVGLIIGPPSVASRIRGSAVQNELVVAALVDLKPLLLSRKEASKELSKEEEDEIDDASTTHSLFSSQTKPKKGSRLDKLEQSQAEIKDMLFSFMRKFTPQSGDESEEFGSETDENCAPEPSPISDLPRREETIWNAPGLPIDTDPEEDFDFAPKTKEQEPAIPAPKPHIAIQGTECQRLGDMSYKQIRYIDAQKVLHASPVFSALKANPVLAKQLSPSPMQEQLTRADYTLGTILHGLLLERDALAGTLKSLSDKHPSLKQDLKSAFSTDSQFRVISNNLLQYVCGRRAEVIEQRRNSLLPKDEYQASILNTIPPSTSHLFCDKEMSDLLKQPAHQNLFREQYKKPFQPKHYNVPQSSSHQRPRSGKIVKAPKPFTRKPNTSKAPENWKRSYGNKQGQKTMPRGGPRGKENPKRN